MKVTILIPARMSATRFPGKPLTPILGKPMIQWVYERCCHTIAHHVMVATDSAEIFDAVKEFGGEVVMTSGEHPNGTSRIAEIAADLPKGLIINVQGDEPAIDPAHVNEVIHALISDRQLEMATLAVQIKKHKDLFNPNVVKVVLNQKHEAMYFSRSPIPFYKHEDMKRINWKANKDTVHFQHIGVYGYRSDFLARFVETPLCYLEEIEGLEQLRALYMGSRIHVSIIDKATIGVDTPEDVARVEKFMKKEGIDS